MTTSRANNCDCGVCTAFLKELNERPTNEELGTMHALGLVDKSGTTLRLCPGVSPHEARNAVRAYRRLIRNLE